MLKKNFLLAVLSFFLIARFNALTSSFSKPSNWVRIKQHLEALNSIGIKHRNREARSQGYNASVEYVSSVIKNLRNNNYYTVQEQHFTYDDSIELTPSRFTWIGHRSLQLGRDFLGVRRQTTGHVSNKPLIFIPNGGCRDSDFSNFSRENVAFFDGGPCYRAAVQRAIKFKASSAVFWRSGFFGSLRQSSVASIPVFIITEKLANEFKNSRIQNRVVISTHIRHVKVVSKNLIVESKQGNSDKVVLVGAHLDGVTYGSGIYNGINDNGSGSASILEMAEMFATRNLTVKNKIRFMWFGAEEYGLIGAYHYVNTLSPKDLAKISVMINMDMVGSINYVRRILNGATTPVSIREQSIIIQKVLENSFINQNKPWDIFTSRGGSDHWVFIQAGIPSTFLHSGTSRLKTAAEARKFGGETGKPLDPCYHRQCDNIRNINFDIVNDFSIAASHCAMVFARSDILKKRPIEKKIKIGLTEDEYYEHQFRI